MMPSHLRVSDLVEYALAEKGDRSFLRLYEKLMSRHVPKFYGARKKSLLYGIVLHEVSTFLWKLEGETVAKMYDRRKRSGFEYFQSYKSPIEDVIYGKIRLKELAKARSDLISLNIPETDINARIRYYAESFLDLRFEEVRKLLRHRQLPNLVYTKVDISSTVLGPLVAGKMDIEEHTADGINIRELKTSPNVFADTLQVSIYGILKSAEFKSKHPVIKTFLDYVDHGPMGIEVFHEKGKEEARRLASSLIEMLKKSKDDVKKMDVKK